MMGEHTIPMAERAASELMGEILAPPPAQAVVSFSPLRRLAFAALEQLVRDASLMPTQPTNPNTQSAYAWLLDDTWEPGSFLWYCEHFDIDGERIQELFRNGATRLTQRAARYS